MSSILPVPPTLKSLQTYLKLATDHEKINPTLTYWCRLYALQTGLKIDSKSKENRDFLVSLMDWLEREKKLRETDEQITTEVVALAHIENYGMKIFLKADEDDRAGNATKNTAKQFFTAAQIFDMSAVFGEVSEELLQKSKYGKWRAAYIIKCIKNNEKPLPPEEEKSNDEQTSDDQQKIDETQNNNENNQNFDIGKPPGPLSFDDVNINKMNDLSIHKPSSALPTTKNYSNMDPSLNRPATSIPSSSPSDYSLVAINGTKLAKDEILKAQKYSKWAVSALDYDDVRTAVNNLQKALNLLTNGSEN